MSADTLSVHPIALQPMTPPISSGSEDDGAAIALIADWLAQQFLMPPSQQQLRTMRSAHGQEALHEIGQTLDQQAVIETLCAVLNADDLEATHALLQRRHTALFLGLFHQRGILPYASLWDGSGRFWGQAVDQMHVILNELDMHLSVDCHEPADHIAVQLTLLAQTLRQNRLSSLPRIHLAIRPWTRPFISALIAADDHGFYGQIARILDALIDTIPDQYTMPTPIKNTIESAPILATSPL